MVRDSEHSAHCGTKEAYRRNRCGCVFAQPCAHGHQGCGPWRRASCSASGPRSSAQRVRRSLPGAGSSRESAARHTGPQSRPSCGGRVCYRPHRLKNTPIQHPPEHPRPSVKRRALICRYKQLILHILPSVASLQRNAPGLPSLKDSQTNDGNATPGRLNTPSPKSGWRGTVCVCAEAALCWRPGRNHGGACPFQSCQSSSPAVGLQRGGRWLEPAFRR